MTETMTENRHEEEIEIVLDDECYCGECGRCRRALREIDRTFAEPILTVEVSYKEVQRKAAEVAARKLQSKKVADAERDRQRQATKDKNAGGRPPVSESSQKAASGASVKRKNFREARKAERIIKDDYWFHPRPDLKHGSPTAYGDHGCRCLACREYMQASSKKYRDSKKSR